MVDLKVLQFVSTVSNDVTKDTMSSLFDVTGKYLSRHCHMIFKIFPKDYVWLSLGKFFSSKNGTFEAFSMVEI